MNFKPIQFGTRASLRHKLSQVPTLLSTKRPVGSPASSAERDNRVGVRMGKKVEGGRSLARSDAMLDWRNVRYTSVVFSFPPAD